jgi:hypothetical protein
VPLELINDISRDSGRGFKDQIAAIKDDPNARAGRR